MTGSVLSRVLDWLRAGYPDGVPPKDYTPLLALLRRTLTPEELGEVVIALTQQETDPVRVSQIRAAISEVTSVAPADDEVHRVAAQLAARGVPLTTKALRIAGAGSVLVAEADSPSEPAGTSEPADREPLADQNPITQVLRWLGAGYPDGIPPQDRVPILALLRRRLTDDEVQEVAETVAAQSGTDPEISLVDAQVLMMRTLGELPSEEDVERVRAHLETTGHTIG